MAAHILSPLASLNTVLLETQLHPSYAPFPLMTTIHAARVSLAFRGICAVTRKKYAQAKGISEDDAPRMTVQQDLAGFLIMAWGGGLLVCYILNIVPPQLLSISPLINYLGVHLLIGLALQFFDAPSAALLDTILPLLDGATRAHAIFVGVNLPKSPAVVKNTPALAGSFTLSLLLGTVAASGGGQTCFTIGAFNPDGWALSTPPILKARSLLDATDVWAPFLGALAYQVMTFSHPAYAPFVRAINAGKAAPILKPQGAKALVTLIVTAAFAWRAAALHWLGKQGPAVHAASAAKAPSAPSARVTRRQANGEKAK